jgi:alginate O-acetyltransferase complex protein AlgJ
MEALPGDAEQGVRSALWEEDEWHALASARLVRDGKLVEGRDGFLFLANDNYDVLAQHSGARRLGERQLDGWRTVLERRTEMLAERGCAHIVMVVPNSHSVYPEKLPVGIETAPERPVHQLMAHLERSGSPVGIVYPLEELVGGKAERLVCSRVDSHWTDYGAFLVCWRLMKEVAALVPARILDMDDVMFVDAVMSRGDLGAKLVPPREATQPFGRMRHPSARLVSENRIQGIGAQVVTECETAPPTTCMLLGDSYCFALLNFLPESFRRLVFLWRPDLPAEVLEHERPDVLISAIAERFLLAVPSDENAVSQAEVERQKRAAGRVRQERIVARAGPDFAPVAKVEAIRSHMIESGSLRDATVVSLIAYAALSPAEVMRLRWSDVKHGFLQVAESETGGRARRVPLWDVVAADLERWRRAVRPARNSSVVSGPDAAGEIREWRRWREESFAPATSAVGLKGLRPWALHNTYVHLRLAEGATPAQVAAETGLAKPELAVMFAVARAREARGPGTNPFSGDAHIRAARAAEDG